MSRVIFVAGLLLAAVGVSGAGAQPAQRIPFQPPAFDSIYLQDAFIVVFTRPARAALQVGQRADATPTANLAGVQAALEQVGALSIRRQFPMLRPEPDGSGRPDLTGHYKVHLPPGADLESALEAFRGLPEVNHVEKIGLHPVFATPNDPYYQNPPPEFPYDQWHYWDTFGVSADLAWDTETGDSSVVVAIVDSGVKFTHADLGGSDPPGPDDPSSLGNIWVNRAEIPGNGLDDDLNGYVDDVIGWDFVDDGSGPGVTCLDVDCGLEDNSPNDGDGHGTHLAGTVAAITNNDRAGAGVAGGYGDGTATGTPNGVRLMCLRIGFRARIMGLVTGVVRMDWAAEAMAYIADQVDRGVNVAAVNCSWGSSDSGGISAAIDAVQARDVLVVNAAGNSGSTVAPFLATKTGVVAVAATDSAGMEASFTNRGSWVDIAAPGVDILSTYHNAEDPDTTHMYIALLSGTSMSAPHVAGVTALLEARDPSLTAQQKFDVMESTVIPYTSSLDLGAGIVNAKAALDALVPVAVGDGVPWAPSGLGILAAPNPALASVSIRVSGTAAEPGRLRIIAPGGQVVREFAIAVGSPPTWQGVWDGRDRHGVRVPAGVYFVDVRRGEQFGAAKVVLLK